MNEFCGNVLVLCCQSKTFHSLDLEIFIAELNTLSQPAIRLIKDYLSNKRRELDLAHLIVTD